MRVSIGPGRHSRANSEQPGSSRRASSWCWSPPRPRAEYNLIRESPHHCIPSSSMLTEGHGISTQHGVLLGRCSPHTSELHCGVAASLPCRAVGRINTPSRIHPVPRWAARKAPAASRLGAAEQSRKIHFNAAFQKAASTGHRKAAGGCATCCHLNTWHPALTMPTQHLTASPKRIRANG